MRAKRPKRLLWLALGCVVAMVFATACAVVPPPTTVGSTAAIDAPKPLDCTHWRYGTADEPAPGVLPAEYDRNNYKRTSLRDPRPELANSPQNQCGQKGDAVDLAWGVTKGRDDVLISVLDSGIMWRDAGRMADLARAAYINIGEARPPCTARDGDCNHDGVFDIADFGPIPDRNSNGVADPEDLILDPKYSNGRDDDHNGYVDDISGWDFLYGDNDPLDTVTYGHGSGEAEDSTARENGTGDVGNCPKCRLLPIRVSDSFIAEGGRFAAGVTFALDSGADVVQEALGALTNPAVTQQAIDAAYKRGVVVVASMADEASKHPNLPGALEHTMAVNSVTEKNDPVTDANSGYLALNGCTNFGGHTFVSVESGSCSSEATGQMSGMVGLLESEARDAHIRPPNALRWYRNGAANVLSANEAMQIVRSTADDVDFARHAHRRPDQHRALPDDTGLGRDVRLRSRQRVRDGEGGARWSHPARSRYHRAELVRRAADVGQAARHGSGRGRPRPVVRLPRRVDDGNAAARVSRSRHLAPRRRAP
jgi:Subtilase family